MFELKVGAALGLGAKKEKIRTIANVVNSKVGLHCQLRERLPLDQSNIFSTPFPKVQSNSPDGDFEVA